MASKKTATTATEDEGGRGKQVIAILPPSDFERLEQARGRVPRSRYVADLILAHLDGLDAAEPARRKR